MTEGYEDGGGAGGAGGEWNVVVRAQVMCRDEGSGGWVLAGGGGLANVQVGRRPIASEAATGVGAPGATHTGAHPFEYYIYGKRITDQHVVLECTIKRDFEYWKVMPTFHHWVTGSRRFGLTFQTAADARAFDRGVRHALHDLLHGGAYLGPAAPRSEDEENIFECLELPSESKSNSETSTASRSRSSDAGAASPAPAPAPHPHTQPQPILAPIAHHECIEMRGTVTEQVYLQEREGDEPYSYVHLTAMPEFMYPQSSGDKPDSSSTGGVGSGEGDQKKPQRAPEQPFPARLRCRYCGEWYLECANGAGSCQYAPDWCDSCIHTASCMRCAQCMVYHCMSEGDGDMPHPCLCRPVNWQCFTRWLGVAMMSLLLPCLCMYPVLKCCHVAARACHLAGGRHKPYQ